MTIKLEIYSTAHDGAGMAVGIPKGVKLTHEETGLVAASESERSQHLNRKAVEIMLAAGLAYIGYKE